MMNRTKSAHWDASRACVCTALTVAAVMAVLVWQPRPAAGQDTVCDSVSDFPCGIQVEEQQLQRAPTLFKLQARVAQGGGIIIGEAKFEKIIVRLTAGGGEFCEEVFKNVYVYNSVMNLEIGREMNCEVDEFIAGNSDVRFEICIGSCDTPAPEMPLISSPYAVRVSFAQEAQRAHRVDYAAQSFYAHRMTADRDLGERFVLGTGYFDLETPGAAAAAPLYDEQEFETYEDGGFLLWTPVRNRTANSLHLAGKTSSTDWLANLAEIVLATRSTRATGAVEVAPLTELGLTVTGRGSHVTGLSTVDGELLVLGPLTVDGSAEVKQATSLESTLLVGSGMTVMPGNLQVGGASVVDGALTVGAQVTVDQNLMVTGDSTVDGLLTASEVMVNEGLTVDVTTTSPVVHVVGDATVSTSITAPEALVVGTTQLTGPLAVNGEMEVFGDAQFLDEVIFLGGTSSPNEPPDMRYLQYANETREVTFGGLMTFLGGTSSGDDFEGNLNQLLNARVHAASQPPVACSADLAGYTYLDTDSNSVVVCLDGQWQGGGGGGGEPSCGNGVVQPPEDCDDGNNDDFDGCTALCQVEYGYDCEGSPSLCGSCGNGSRQGAEECDDGNLAEGDGCSAGCKVENGWLCAGEELSACAPPANGGSSIGGPVYMYGLFWYISAPKTTCDNLCADLGGVNLANLAVDLWPDNCDAPEADDVSTWFFENDNPADWTGPDATSRYHLGYGFQGKTYFGKCADPTHDSHDGVFPGESADTSYKRNIVCTCFMPEPESCGSGQLDVGEECDDGDGVDGDGCSRFCSVEAGFTCNGQPSNCVSCGNGDVWGDEECDDGNQQSGDGCGSTCKIEQGWKCSGEPSSCQPTNPCPQGTAHVNGYCWVQAIKWKESHYQACSRIGKPQTPKEVTMTWNNDVLSKVAAVFGYGSIGDYLNSAKSMWCNPSTLKCGTHNWGNKYTNYGHYGNASWWPVYTCNP